MQAKIRITKNLIVLERGREELLLANSFYLYPLYTQRGRGYIKNFLKSAEKLGTVSKIKKNFPHDSPLLDMLIERKIILPRSAKERYSRSDISSQRERSEKKKYICLYLLLNQFCNLGCIYCLLGKNTYQMDKNLKMSEKVAYKSVERYLQNLAAKGHLEIIFFGGEPLLNWPLAKKIIGHCEKTLRSRYPNKSISYHITTNLASLPNDVIAWAKKYKISFLCDLDGPGKLHDQLRPFKNGRSSFRHITKNIKRLKKAGIDIFLRSTVTAVNQHHMLEIAKLHKAIGGKGCGFVPVNAANSDRDILPESLLPSPEVVIKGLEKVYRSGIWDSKRLYPFSVFQTNVGCGSNTTLGCGAPSGLTPVVQANGDTYPCIYLVGIKKFCLGNVFDKKFPNDHICDWMTKSFHVDNLKECRVCQWRYICGGSCPMLRFTVLENPSVRAPAIKYTRKIMCDYSKKIFELLLWEKAKESTAFWQKKIDSPKKSVTISKIC